MNIFAHNGVDHSSTSEAVTHAAPDVVLTVVLVTAAVLVLLGAAVWALRHFGLVAKDSAKKGDK